MIPYFRIYTTDFIITNVIKRFREEEKSDARTNYLVKAVEKEHKETASKYHATDSLSTKEIRLRKRGRVGGLSSQARNPGISSNGTMRRALQK